MNNCAIYLSNGQGPDPAIVRGLVGAGFEVHDTHSIAETLTNVNSQSCHEHIHHMLLVAEVQSGAIPLLTLLRNNANPLPPTLVLDNDGASIRHAIEALNLGVRDYILASDPPFHRELRARVLAEQTLAHSVSTQIHVAEPAAEESSGISAPTPAINFVWDARANAIMAQGHFIRLSPVEGHMFDLLVSRCDEVVSVEELIKCALHKQYEDINDGIKVLRPHMMRLRKKLDHSPIMAHRVTTVRGNGYMFS
jgi:DNA-binding response OmpR family regulator